MKKSILFICLFINISLFAFGQADISFKQDVSHILGNGSEDSWLFSWEADVMQQSSSSFFNADCSVNYLTSTVPFVRGDVINASVLAESGNSYGSLFFNADMASSQNVKVGRGVNVPYQDDLSFEEVTFGFSTGVTVIVKPFVMFGRIDSSAGDCLYFKGKFDDSSVKAAGITASYGEHSASFVYGDTDINIYDNSAERILGTAGGKLFGGSYFFKYGAGNWSFTSGIGYAGLFADIGLNLTKENQKYLGFPMDYLNFDMTGSAHIVSFMQECTLNRKNSCFLFDMDGYFCAYSEFTSLIKWQFRNSTSLIYKYIFEALNVTAGADGYTKMQYKGLQFAAFILPRVKYTHSVKIGKAEVDVSFSKQFPLAFKIGDYGTKELETSSRDGKPLPELFTLDLPSSAKELFGSAAGYLFSGLSLLVSIYY